MDGFSLHVDFRPLSFTFFFAVCCVANDDDYGDGGADGIGKAEKIDELPNGDVLKLRNCVY